MDFKLCTKCGEDKPLSGFYSNKGRRISACRVCTISANKSRNATKASGKYVSLYSQESRQNSFLIRAKEVRGEDYDYSESVVSGHAGQVNILCKKHFQKFTCTQRDHLEGAGAGCPTCRSEHLSSVKKKPVSKYIDDCNAVYGVGLYSYENTKYHSYRGLIEVFCNKHESYFSVSANSHLSGSGCPQCRNQLYIDPRADTTEDFLAKVHKVHGNRYSCHLSKYKNNHNRVELVCDDHGSFFIRPTDCYRGGGCPTCASYGYNKGIAGSIYVLSDGTATKVGITNRDVSTRLSEIKKSSRKDFEELYSCRYEDGTVAYAIEYSIKRCLSITNEPVKEKYDGSTESFLGVEPQSVIKDIKIMAKILQGFYD